MRNNLVTLSALLVVMYGCGSDDMTSPSRSNAAKTPTIAPMAGSTALQPTAAASGGAPSGIAQQPVPNPNAVLPMANKPPVNMMPPVNTMTPVPMMKPAPTDTTPPPTTGGKDPRMPAKVGECPKLVTGNVMVMGQNVQLWVGAKQAEKKGPVMFYWHGTGSFPGEAAMLGGALSEIQQQGGLVASFDKTTMKGQNTGNAVWYTGDFEMADQILACAVEQLNIDTRRVYSSGCSAGGLQVGAMVYQRSSYLAGAMTNSGGTVFPYKLEDPAHVPALITAHGMMGKDVVGVDFSTTSATMTKDIAAKKGFAVNCDHGGGHCAAPSALVAAQWQFLKAHPFGVTPDPYANGLPSTFPQYCQIVK